MADQRDEAHDTGGAPASHAQESGRTKASNETGPPARRFARPSGDLGRSAAGVLATIVSVVTTIVVVILAVHILFVVFEANPANDIVSTVRDWADDLAWKFRDVFEPEDAKFRVAVNYGLAAVVYLIVGRVLVNLIRRLG